MNWLNILVQYWSQILVLVLGLGFIIKAYFDWSIRKNDILFSKVYDSKLNEIKEFLHIYIELERLLKQLPFLISQKTIDYSKIRQDLSDLTLKFELHATYVRFFLKKREMLALEELHKKVNFIIEAINELEINVAFNHTDKELFKKLTTINTVVFEQELPTLIKEIERNFKKDYKIT